MPTKRYWRERANELEDDLAKAKDRRDFLQLTVNDLQSRENARLYSAIGALPEIPRPDPAEARFIHLVFVALAELIEGRALAIETKTGNEIAEYERLMRFGHDMRLVANPYVDVGCAIEIPAFVEVLNAISEDAR